MLFKLTTPKSIQQEKFFKLQTRDDVAELLEVNERNLRIILYGLEERKKYTSFLIPKKSGGYREIHKPPQNLSILQKKLAGILLDAYRVKPCVHGFVKDKSVVSNANSHIGKKHLINVDLKNFFPSIHIGRITATLFAAPYSLGYEAAQTIGQICTMHNGELPQGAPTSPIVSNIVAKPLDVKLQDLATKHHCTYTRYADDISFSTTVNTIPTSIIQLDPTTSNVTCGLKLNKAILDSGFEINTSKVRYLHPNIRQEVTGITINESANLRRKFIREIETLCFICEKHGYDAGYESFLRHRALPHSIKGHKPNLLYKVLAGKLSYLKMVKGESDAVYRRLAIRLHQLNPEYFDEPIRTSKVRPVKMTGLRGRFRGWQNHVSRLQSSLLFIETTPDRKTLAVGTAFIVDRQTAITAGHVARARFLKIWLGDEEVKCLDVSYLEDSSSNPDIGILHFKTNTFIENSPFSMSMRLPQLGEEILALGYPSIPGRNPTVVSHSGTVEALTTTYCNNNSFVQTSFHGGGGLSGSPVIDHSGNVIAIMTENVFIDSGPNVPVRPYGQASPIEYAVWTRRKGNAKHSAQYTTLIKHEPITPEKSKTKLSVIKRVSNWLKRAIHTRD